MKKIICLLVAVVMMMGLFVACGNNQSSSSQQSQEEKPDVTKMNAEEIVNQIKSKGLPIDNIIVYTEETDSNQLLGRPNQYTSKVNFADTRVEQPEDKSNPVGGSIEVFESEEDATARKEYVEGIASKMSVFSQYFYLYKNILLRIDHDLTPAQASEYESAFKELQ